MAVTKDQALQAVTQLGITATTLNELNVLAAQASAEQTKLATFDLAAAQSKVADKIAGITAELTAVNTKITNMNTVIAAYNTQNPGDPVAVAS